MRTFSSLWIAMGHSPWGAPKTTDILSRPGRSLFSIPESAVVHQACRRTRGSSHRILTQMSHKRVGRPVLFSCFKSRTAGLSSEGSSKATDPTFARSAVKET